MNIVITYYPHDNNLHYEGHFYSGMTVSYTGNKNVSTKRSREIGADTEITMDESDRKKINTTIKRNLRVCCRQK